MTPELKAFLICLLARIPVFWWGEPGIGKTKATEAAVRALQERLWTLILGIRDPSDQAGIPVLRNGSMWMAPPRWADELVEVGQGVVYLDELNAAVPTTQNSALRVVNEGWAGDCKLPEETSWTASGNPPETNPGVFDLTPAMANRFCHIEFALDVDAWCDGMVAGWPEPKIVPLPEGWRDGIVQERSKIATFIRRRGAAFLHAKPDSPTEQGKAWASPRTWDMAATLKAAAQAMGHGEKDEVQRVLVRGCVGEGASTEFFSWVVNLDLKDPEEYLSNPKGTPLPTRQDQIMATLSGVASAALDRKKHKRPEQLDRHYAAWLVIGRVIHKMNAPDVTIPSARVLAAHMLPEMEDNLPDELRDILPILEEGGIDFGGAS